MDVDLDVDWNKLTSSIVALGEWVNLSPGLNFPPRYFYTPAFLGVHFQCHSVSHWAQHGVILVRRRTWRPVCLASSDALFLSAKRPVAPHYWHQCPVDLHPRTTREWCGTGRFSNGSRWYGTSTVGREAWQVSLVSIVCPPQHDAATKIRACLEVMCWFSFTSYTSFSI